MQDWRKNKLVFAILMAPATFWLVVFFTIPLAIVWVYSFGGRGPEGQTLIQFSFDNYRRALEWIHLGIIWKSAVIASITTAACLVLGFPLALAIAFAPARLKNVLLLLVILPFWTNLLIRTYSWIAVLRERGFLNFGLEWLWNQADWTLTLFGMPDLMGDFQPLRLLYNLPAVVIALIHVHLPFMVLPLYATLEKIDRSLIEAALDLGSPPWRAFWTITVPLSLPGIVAGSLLCFIPVVGEFVIPDLLGGSETLMIGRQLWSEFFSNRDWPLASAVAILLLVILVVPIVIYRDFEARRLEARP
jgi:ABC-type spermidine/putrescine transport system permease subunit I